MLYYFWVKVMKSIFVYNPESGQKKISQYIDLIKTTIESKYGELDIVPTTHAGHANEIAKTLAKNYDYFFVAGGDGTLNEVVNGLGSQRKKPIVGYIPTGTVNDCARSLGISLNIKKAIRNLVEGEPFAHDTFKVNDKFGIYVCGAGLFTQASYKTPRKEKKLLGKIAYIIGAAKELMHSKPVKVSIKTGGETIKETCSLMLIFNSKSVGSMRLNKGAKLNDGKVEVVLFKSFKKTVTLIDVIRIVSAFLFGIKRVKNKKYIVYRQFSNFTVSSTRDIPINLDGEKATKGSFVFNVWKQSIQIIAPKQK